MYPAHKVFYEQLVLVYAVKLDKGAVAVYLYDDDRILSGRKVVTAHLRLKGAACLGTHRRVYDLLGSDNEHKHRQRRHGVCKHFHQLVGIQILYGYGKHGVRVKAEKCQALPPVQSAFVIDDVINGERNIESRNSVGKKNQLSSDINAVVKIEHPVRPGICDHRRQI